MTTFRRHLLGMTMLAGLAACNPAQTAQVQRLAMEASAITTGFSRTLATMTTVITQAARDKLQGYLDQIKAAADAVASAATTAAAQQPVGQIITSLGGFVSLLPGLGLPDTMRQTITEILAAAQVLVPIMAAAVGLAAAPPVKPAMTEEQALVILNGRR